MSPIRIMTPTISRRRSLRLTARLSSLKGKTIGTLWDNKPHGDEFLHLVSEELARSHGASRVVHMTAPYPGSMAPASIIADLAAVADVVIVGVGD